MTEPTAPVLRGDPFSEPLDAFNEKIDALPEAADTTPLERHLIEALARVSNAFHFMLHSDDERQGQEALSRVLGTLSTVEPLILRLAPTCFPEWFTEPDAAAVAYIDPEVSPGARVSNSADHVE